MRLARCIAAGAVASCVAAACTLPSYDEYSAGGGPMPDAGGTETAPPVALPDSAPTPIESSPDAAADGVATDAAARVNLIEGNGATFDNGSCKGTSKPEYNVAGFNASLSSDTTARTGAGSCRVCRNVEDGFFTIDTNFLAPVPVGTYHARAWVRSPPGVQGFPVLIFLRTMKGDYTEIESRESKELVLTDQWQSIEVTFDVRSPTPRMDTFLGGDPSNTVLPACFLVDDYEVWRD